MTLNVCADVINHPKTGSLVRTSCDSYDLSISPNSKFLKNSIISDVNVDQARFKSIKQFNSPFNDSYLKVLNPDFMVIPLEPEGWTTSIYVKQIDGHEIEITIRNHNNSRIKAFWEDNDTIIIEAWWGRIAQSILRLDLYREIQISSKDINHYESILPCLKNGT